MKRNIEVLAAAVVSGTFIMASGAPALASPAQSGNWQTPAQWHRFVKKAVLGTLLLDDDGVPIPNSCMGTAATTSRAPQIR